MTNAQLQNRELEDLDLSLERDGFMRRIIRELSGLLDEMVGEEESSGFISVVGQRMGDQINSEYKKALNVPSLNREQVAQTLLDLKLRIKGDFYIIESDESKIVLGNRSCPFGSMVKDRPSLCMMTSNVFGTITSENLGYSKVSLQSTIAKGDAECRVVVYLKPNEEAQNANGREYYKSEV